MRDLHRDTEHGAGSILLAVVSAFPIACFTLPLATDLAYLQTAQMMWANFSAWLLAMGMASGVLAVVIGTVLLLMHRRMQRRRPVWPVVVGALLTLVAGLIDNFVHSRDAWTSVVPTGLALSAVTAVLVLITAWLGFMQAGTVRA